MKRSRLKPVSDKRRAENAERRANVTAAYGSRPPCYACPTLRREGIDTGCDGRATDAHEILSRSAGGSITDVGNIVPIGRRCHEWVTENGPAAQALGLARSRYG